MAGALAGVAFGAAAEVLAIGLGSAVLAARGIPIRLDGGDHAQLLFLIVYTVAAVAAGTLATERHDVP